MSAPDIEFSDHKDSLNQRDHHVSLDLARKFDFDSAQFYPDDSQDYGEVREIAIGFIAGKLYTLVFTALTESLYRVISLRESSRAEEYVYANY